MREPTIAQVDAAVKAALAGSVGTTNRGGAPFAGKLLGARQAEAIEEGVREVRVESGTVVTPLGRDVLKARGIAVRFVSRAEAVESGARGEWGFAIESETWMTAAIRRELLEGSESWIEVGREVREAAAWVAQRPNRGAALLTTEASVAVWRANGFEALRAASASEPDGVSRSIRSLGVNLLVIEPAGKSIPWIRHLLATYRRGGAPRLPEGLSRGSLARVDRDEDRRSYRPRDPVPHPPGPAERALRDRLAHAALGAGRGLFAEG